MYLLAYINLKYYLYYNLFHEECRMTVDMYSLTVNLSRLHQGLSEEGT